MASLTPEQQLVCDYAKTAKDGSLILIDAVAGSGKTTVLTKLADTVQSKHGLYLAYNKALAVEAQRKFPSSVDCRTTHSLAYRATVKPMGLDVGFFGPRDIDEQMSYEDKYFLVEDIREFCLSNYLSYDEYAEASGRVNVTMANKYLNLMSQGKISCTHDFYLKAFHISLASGDVDCPEYDLLMLDEAGDLNAVTLEIFKLLPSKLKIAVGDPHQNIYTFNHTINCFEHLDGKVFRLSKSFRVPTHIAEPIERFCKTYLNPEMKFEGIDTDKKDIKTRAYISRTNSGLISKLIELNQQKVPYGLVRKAQEIFKVPLMVAGLKYQGRIYDPAYKHIQEDVNDWYEDKHGVKTTNPSLLAYLKDRYEEDISLVQAVTLVLTHGKSMIFEAYAEAKNHENKKQDLLLLTAHSSKGLEFDEVTLAPDMNTSTGLVIDNIDRDGSDRQLSAQEIEALNLYYVASTRALVRLRNATLLSVT